MENKEEDIRSSEYYYNVPGSTFLKMGYIEALELKIKLSKKLIKELCNVHYMDRDTYRISKSLESQKFNQRLIDEALEKI